MSRDAITLTVPVPPTTNLAYATVRGRRVLSLKGREFKNDVGRRVLFGKDGWHYTKGQRLALTLALYFRNHQRRDISNCVKLLEDALSEALGFDDCAVDVLHVERAGIDKQNPRCEVELKVLEVK